MKKFLKRMTPAWLMKIYIRMRRCREDRRNSKLTPAEVFSRIYKDGSWSVGEKGFCSGIGTISTSIVEPYIDKVSELISAMNSRPRILDLGCGDFSVGRQLVKHASKYIGVDVVPELIAHHRAVNQLPNVEFVCLDMTRDDLPDADVCLVRQVFQHLSNEQILAVLPKLTKFSCVIVTEHCPSESDCLPNLDKVHGSGIRLFSHSGVFLDKAPFDRFVKSADVLLEVPGHGFIDYDRPSVIRTVIIGWKAAEFNAQE